MYKPNIRSLISQEDTCTLLLGFFPDSIILSQQLEIVNLGEQVKRSLNLKKKDFQGNSIECLSYKRPLKELLQKELSKGYFNPVNILLKGKTNVLECTISGFYLGLVSELNDKILIRVRPRNQVALLRDQLEKSRDELDEFVYRTAHDLRGPLATIRGLISLMKLENPSAGAEMGNLIHMMETQADTMDSRLHNLTYLSEFAFSSTEDNNLDCASLESKLRASIEETIPIDHLDFRFECNKRFVKGVNVQLFTSMVNHIILYLINLPNSASNKLEVRLESSKDTLWIAIASEGFLTDYQLREAIKQKTPLYTNIVSYSKLINFFAAQKAAQRMNGFIKVDYIKETTQRISALISRE